MTLKGWQKTSIIEYPGKIATVVFTGGCNFRCPFCYNADLVERPQEISDLPGQTVLQFLQKNRTLYQALVISGGEPTLHAELPEFMSEVKTLGLYTGLETNGTNPDMLGRLLEDGLVDYVAMDVKAPLHPEPYGKAAGLKGESQGLVEEVKQALGLLKSTEAQVELRCTVVPRLHTREDILLLARQLQGHSKFVLQQFAPERALDPQLRTEEPFKPEELREIYAKLADLFPLCEIRGI